MVNREEVSKVDSSSVALSFTLTCVIYILFTCIYRSPSQDEFKNFCTNFDILLSNINDKLPLCSIVTGDFDARWWKNDITNF